jgi:UDP-N-acetylmuramoylalanine--D-glutamate ligase
MAAWALCAAAGLSDEPLAKAMREFKGLPHRVEWVAKIGGVDFYDDSKGTNVGATEAALNGMDKQVVLIVGGEGKGQDFTPLAAAVKKSARAVVQIGRDGELIAQAIASAGVPILRAESMEQAVSMAYAQAQAGDAVLLSPACASFDMFKNYAHRAEVFIAAVKSLPEVSHG